MRAHPVTVAALATAAVALAGAAVYGASRRGPRVPRRPNPAPAGRSPEPPEGYAARWGAARMQALQQCLVAADVHTFAQAVTCALNTAFPEAAPWTHPGSWTAWMQGAAQLVQRDLLGSASRDGASPRGWELSLWLQGRQQIAACRQVMPSVDRVTLALCAARRLHPHASWDGPLQPWQHGLLRALTEGP